MATESVDDPKLDAIFDKYDMQELYMTVGTFNEIRAALLAWRDAYYTRECARKVLEGRIDTAQTALRACPTQDDKLRKWLEQHIVSLRAAIQEMEGK